MEEEILQEVIDEIESIERVKISGDWSFLAGVDLCLEILNRKKCEFNKQKWFSEEEIRNKINRIKLSLQIGNELEEQFDIKGSFDDINAKELFAIEILVELLGKRE